MQFQVQPFAPAFDDFYALLTQLEVMHSPAEIHGVLCGLVCIGPKLNGGFWIDVLLKHLRIKSQQETVLELYDMACRQLSGQQSFRLLLPDKSCALKLRAEALSFWCEGFLHGLSILSEDSIDEDTPETVCEALYCIEEIAKIDIDQLQITEFDKLIYEETIEFITRAIPLIYEEVKYCAMNKNIGDVSYLH